MKRATVSAVSSVVLAAAMLAAPAPTALATTDPCDSRRSRPLLEEGKTRVIHAYNGRVYACYARTRATSLLPAPARYPVPEDFDIAGRYVAAIGEDDRVDGIEDPIPLLTVVDARRRKRILTISEDGDWSVFEAVLRANGSLAWTETVPQETESAPSPAERQMYQVRARDADGERVLDRGLDLDPESLALSRARARIYWVHGDIPKSATLR